MSNWHPSYEAQFGVEFFGAFFKSTLSSPVSSCVLQDAFTFYFIDLTVVVDHYYGYLPIS